MEKIIKYLWGIFLFTFPFSIRFLVYEGATYRFGNFNPWVTGFVYLPEVLLGLIFVLWFIQKVRKKEKVEFKNETLWFLFFLFLLNAFAVSFINGDPLLGAFFVLRAFEGLVIFWLVQEKFLEPKQIISILFMSAGLQIVWGFAQWKFNSSLGLTWLGESIIGPDVLGVAKNDLIEGVKQVRAYGSFLHPNILAGYLLAIFFLGLNYLNDSNKFFWFAVFAWGIFLTGSRAAQLVLVAGLGGYFLFTVFRAMPIRRFVGTMTVIALAVVNIWFFQNSHLVNVRDLSWQERLSQNVISRNMSSDNPFGVGVSNFTLKMDQYNADKLLPWEFQPVHNTYFLIMNETGVQGLFILFLFLFLLFYKYWKGGKAIPILVILLLAPFDHFLWDAWVPVVLIGLVAGFFARENKHHVLMSND